jgi:hypothetical protein
VLGRFLADVLPPWSLSSLADALLLLLLDILSLVDALHHGLVFCAGNHCDDVSFLGTVVGLGC